MRKFIALFLTFSILLVTLSLGISVSGFAASDNSGTAAGENYVANELIITYAADTADTRSLPLESAQIIETDALGSSDETVIKGTVEYGTDIEQLCEELEQREDIVCADPNYIQKIDEIDIPDEARRTGSDFNAFNWYRDALHLTDAWRTADTLGSEDIVVAVIDTGVNTEHKDLQGAMWTDAEGHYGYNAIEQNYDVSDSYGHGSNVAGIIAMRANDYGYVGIAPQVKIMACKAATNQFLTDTDILACLNYAVDNGADIINMSFGSKTLSPTMATAYQRASAKTVLIAAAGNDGNDAALQPQYPAACGGVTGVMSYGSTKKSDLTNYTIDNGTLSVFSNYDKTGRFYQIAAPGVEIAGPAPTGSNTGFTFKSGTSQATPIVAGAAAIYLSLHPDATPYQVRSAITDSANETVAGYGDKLTRYKKINLSAMWSTAPCEDKAVNLSADAKNILSACLDMPLDTVHQSEMQALTVIPYTAAQMCRTHLEALAELNTVQFLELYALDLTDAEMAWLKDASFSRLYELNISSNPQLTALRIGENTAPKLRYLNADNCALTAIEGLEHLPLLYSLSLSGNGFVSSYDFEHLHDVSVLTLSRCKLQDVGYFPQLRSLVYLDVSENYICDVSPLAAFRGYHLDISSNPLNLGVSQGDILRIIEKNIRNNRYDYDDIYFNHTNENGVSDKTYIPAKTMRVQSLTVPRTAQSAKLNVRILPENANVGSVWSCRVKDKDVRFERSTASLSWDSAAIITSKEFECEIIPCAGFANISVHVRITAPEILEYYTPAHGNNYLVAGSGTEYIQIANQIFESYTQSGDTRIFDLSELRESNRNKPATAFDNAGAGNTVAPQAVQELPAADSATGAAAALLDFSADKETYSTSQTATLSARASEAVNFVKFYNYNTKQSVIVGDFTTQEDVRIFRICVPIETKGDYYWKAYAGESEAFENAPLPLRFHAVQSVCSMRLSTAQGSEIYMNGEEVQLQAEFLPESAEVGKDLSFSSSDTDIVTVTDSGKLQAKDYGNAIISAENENGLCSRFPVFVLPPKMSTPEVTNATYPMDTTVTSYTKGASDIILQDEDGNETTLSYETTAAASDKEEYDTLWSIRITPENLTPQKLFIYAADKSGIHAKTPHKKIEIAPLAMLDDFGFEQEEYHFSRTAADARVSVITNPENFTAFEWSVSDTSIATLTPAGKSCLLTPKKSGTLTLSATAIINAQSVSKSVTVTFEPGGILTCGVNQTSVNCYETLNVFATTDRSIRSIKLTDVSNSLSETYSASGFAKDSGDTRSWQLPFSYKRASNTLRVTAQDAIGDCDSRTLRVSSTLPDSGIAANPAFVSGEAGSNKAFNLITLPSRANISTLRYTVQIEDESIASFSAGTIRFLKEGETTMHCTYGDITVDVPIRTFVNIQSIRLSGNAKNLAVGESYQIVPVTTPASTQSLQYSSDNPAVATVTAEGLVKAAAPGKATITVSAISGVSTTLKIGVSEQSAAQELSFDRAAYEVGVGEAVDCLITASVPVVCISSNEKVITVDEDNRFIALKEGTATIYAMTDSAHIVSAKVTVSANRMLTLSKELLTMDCNTYTLLFVYLSPSTADLDGAWYSDNEAVATVDQNGIVYAKSSGTCRILFVSDRGEAAACTVQVNEAQVTSLNFYDTEINIKVNEHHFILFSADSALSAEDVVWESEDTSIAAVDSNGIIYGCGSGRTMINAYLPNGVAYGIYVSVYADALTLSGTIKAPNATLYLIGNDNKTNKRYTVESGFEIENVDSGSYTLRITAPHHTSIYVYEAELYEDMDLGTLQLYNGDANRDGIVDLADISLLLKSSNYGASAMVSRKQYDMNDDGTIDVRDIEIILLAQNYGGKDTSINM
ncbi:MAG: S8 family serine peptidase [Clostridia bacterium]|nr:S8 family serine peptidase [Clostridia bacterium]